MSAQPFDELEARRTERAERAAARERHPSAQAATTGRPDVVELERRPDSALSAALA